MVIKLIPLVIIAVAGLVLGKPGEFLVKDIGSFQSVTTSWGWLAAFAPIAFSFDGWIIATTICNEIRIVSEICRLHLPYHH
jgi:APA family basic amino acid/polyamine antiporter